MSVSTPTYIDESLMFVFTITMYASGSDTEWINYVVSNRTSYWVSDSITLNGYVASIQQLVVFGVARQIQRQLDSHLPQAVVDIMVLYVVEYGAIVPNPSGHRPSWLRPWNVDEWDSLRWRTHPNNANIKPYRGVSGNVVQQNNNDITGRMNEMTEWHEGGQWGQLLIVETGPMNEDKEDDWDGDDTMNID